MRRALGALLALVARVWVATLRVRVEAHPALVRVRDRRWVLAFWHGTQLALQALPRRGRTAVMVSLSRDGDMQAVALRLLGFQVVRGSTSRGGVRALAALVRAMRGGADAVFAVDGPRGPYGVPKPGAVSAARLAGGVVVPAGCAAARARVLSKTWDRFVLPLPFTRVRIVLGAPIEPEEGALGRVGEAIAECNARAASTAGEAPGAASSVPLA